MSRLSAAQRQVEALQEEVQEALDRIAFLESNVPGAIWAKMRKWYPDERSIVYDFRAAIRGVVSEDQLTREEVIAWLLPVEEG